MRRGYDAELELANRYCLPGSHAERVAASGGRQRSVCDVVAVVHGQAVFIEVKATSAPVLHASRFRDRLEKLRERALDCGALPLLAVLFRRRGWLLVPLSAGVPGKVVPPPEEGPA